MAPVCVSVLCITNYEKVSDVAESRVWFASKNLTTCSRDGRGSYFFHGAGRGGERQGKKSTGRGGAGNPPFPTMRGGAGKGSKSAGWGGAGAGNMLRVSAD